MVGQLAPTLMDTNGLKKLMYMSTPNLSVGDGTTQVLQFTQDLSKNGYFWGGAGAVGLLGGLALAKKHTGNLKDGWQYILTGAALPAGIIAILALLGIAFKYLT